MGIRTRVVSFGSGKWYPRGMERLRTSLADVGYTGPDNEFVGYSSEVELDAPQHALVPYAFKLAAIQGAIDAGVDVVIWADAAIHAIKPLNAMIAHIHEHGYSIMSSCARGERHMCGVWTNDKMLKHFDVTRDFAMALEQHSACVVGLAAQHPNTRALMHKWRAAVPFFPGAWNNDKKTESHDPRCRGHRHDQAALSLIAYQLGMGPSYHRDEGFVAYAKLATRPLRDSVCLVSEGM